jgi:hypothetical protein
VYVGWGGGGGGGCHNFAVYKKQLFSLGGGLAQLYGKLSKLLKHKFRFFYYEIVLDRLQAEISLW